MKGIQELEICGASMWYNDDPPRRDEAKQDPPIHVIDQHELEILDDILKNMKWFPGLQHLKLDGDQLYAPDDWLMSLFRKYIEEGLASMKEQFTSKAPPVGTATRSVEWYYGNREISSESIS